MRSLDSLFGSVTFSQNFDDGYSERSDSGKSEDLEGDGGDDNADYLELPDGQIVHLSQYYGIEFKQRIVRPTFSSTAYVY
jgi:hypothetical protein